MSSHQSPGPFPTVRWPESAREVTFSPSPVREGPVQPPAVIVFAAHRDRFVLANVLGRGWCVPGGRIEPGESPIEAAVRETREEIGGELEGAREIGHYVLTDDSGEDVHVPAFIGRVHEYGAIPEGSESIGTREVSLPDLPACYYYWDELFARVFEYAEQELRRNP